MSIERLPAPPLPAWLESLVPYQRYRVDVDGQRMHVMETGEGLPVVMVHGNPTWGFLYRKVVQQLSAEPLRIILPDLIGLGLSDKPRFASMHQLDSHIGWLSSLLRQLELERCVMVVQDWGGPIGVGALAETHIEAGLVVLNTVLSPPREGFRASAFHRFARMPLVSELAFNTLGLTQRAMFVAQGDKRSIDRQARRAYTYPLGRGEIAPLALARMVPNDFDHPSIEPLARIQRYVERFEGPAAIVWGDRDPVLGSVRNWMQKLLPRASMTRTGAGHFLQEEVPEEIAGAVREVVAQL